MRFIKRVSLLIPLLLILALGPSRTDSSTKCTNCDAKSIASNCSGTNITNSTNCTDCTNCSNVTNCVTCIEVHDSINVSNSEMVFNSSLISNSKNIHDSWNVSNSETCYSCWNCFKCMSCSDCAGYNCQNDQGCRNSRWLFQWIEPDESDTNAWKCSNKVVNDWYFNKGGYKKPDFLSQAARNGGDLDFCTQFNGNMSCCDKETTSQLLEIFKDYKATLQQRATQKITDIKSIFEQYKSLDLSSVPGFESSIKQGVVEQMRQIKNTIYSIAKNMASCGRSILTYVSGMLCLGCLPDWRWEKFVLHVDLARQQSAQAFDPEKLLNFTLDLNNDPLQLSVLVGRQICEDVFSACKPIMQNFDEFSNNSALAVGGFADEITDNQWNFNKEFDSNALIVEYRNNVTNEIKNLSQRNVNWLKPAGSETGIDTKTVPTYTPTAAQLAMGDFKSSLRSLGSEYPYDPVAYYNFNPSINFEDPITMTDEMCKLMTGATNCTFCSLITDTNCEKIDPTFFEIQTETDKQYRDFSAYFFQVKVVNLYYSNTGVDDVINRFLLFPPFREGEIFIQLKGQSWDYKKKYFQVLEANIMNQYLTFKSVRGNQDEFRIWNDEYWMNFIYSPALNQGGTFFKNLSSQFQGFQSDGSYRFVCDLNKTCVLCQNGSCQSLSGYQPYCEDCHFSNVKIQADCENKGCITCLYIGGGDLPYTDTDIDEEDLDDEPMDRCYIRADNPFYYPNSDDYYAPFYRESDEKNYGMMETLFDLNNEAEIPWNIAQIGQWFYKINGSEYFSVKNLMKVKDSIKLPNTTNCTHYDFLLPCDLNNPINQCKRWICNFLIDGFFPNFKIVYDPQDQNSSAYEYLFANSSIFNYELYKATQQKVLNGETGSSWNLSYGNPDPNQNTNYYDVSYFGPGTTSASNLQISVAGIGENTDIIRFVQDDEKDVGAIRMVVIQGMVTLAIALVIYW